MVLKLPRIIFLTLKVSLMNYSHKLVTKPNYNRDTNNILMNFRLKIKTIRIKTKIKILIINTINSRNLCL